jgi:hypothetical protein
MVNIGFDVSLLIGLVGCLLAILTFFNGQRKAAILEGKHLKSVEELEKRQVALEAKVSSLTVCYQNTDADIREIKTDIEWIREALKEIKAGLVK